MNQSVRRRVFIPGWLAGVSGIVVGCALGLALAFLADHAAGRRARVGAAGQPAGRLDAHLDGRVRRDADFSSIADAMAQARPGDTIRVAPGEYRAPIELRPGDRAREREASRSDHQAGGRRRARRRPSSSRRAAARGSPASGSRAMANARWRSACACRVRRPRSTTSKWSAPRYAAVLFEERAGGALRGSALHDNQGPGVVVRAGCGRGAAEQRDHGQRQAGRRDQAGRRAAGRGAGPAVRQHHRGQRRGPGGRPAGRQPRRRACATTSSACRPRQRRRRAPRRR